MKRVWWAGLTAAIAAGFTVLTMSAANPPIALIGMGLIPGITLDLSKLDGDLICRGDDLGDCIDQATFGGWGSGLTYTGRDNVFLAAPDRGPFDGRTNVAYLDRFHFLHITVEVGSPFPNIKTLLLDTRFLKNERNQNFLGDSSAFDDATPRATLRLDPEVIAISNDGEFFVSDEYGPYVFRFDRQGHLTERLAVPTRFLLAPGGATGDVDSAGNSLVPRPRSLVNIEGRDAPGRQGATTENTGRI